MYHLCSDECGAYYWHIKSGTIQRERPTPINQLSRQVRSALDIVSRLLHGRYTMFKTLLLIIVCTMQFMALDRYKIT